jgi:transcription initiation factor IIF auxiliary subunit
MSRTIPLTVVCVLLGMELQASAQDISAANTSRYLGERQWSWTVFIKAPPAVLNEVKCVEYTLHPTFPNPVQTVCVRGSNDQQAFPLTASGWGTFDVRIKVLLKSGKSILLSHNLTFESPAAASSLPITTGNSVIDRQKKWVKWMVYLQGPENALAQVKCVEYTLHPTFPDPVQEVCDRGTDAKHAFPLTASGWGTFTISIRVFLKSGGVQQLHHELKF